MLDAACARYGNQDIHKLRGLKRRLRPFEKLIFSACVQELMDAEFSPRDVDNLFGSKEEPREDHD